MEKLEIPDIHESGLGCNCMIDVRNSGTSQLETNPPDISGFACVDICSTPFSERKESSITDTNCSTAHENYDRFTFLESDRVELDLEAHSASGNLNCSTNSDISVGSLVVFEQTPRISDGIITPNISQDSINSDEQSGADILEDENTSTQNILLEAGYDLAEVKAITCITPANHIHNDGEYGRNRPQTQVFSQGRIFTYEKLEVEPPQTKMKHKSKLMPSKQSTNTEGNNQGEPFPPYNIAESSPVILRNNGPGQLDKDAFTVLKDLRIQNLKNVIIGQLNINSLRNKFDELAELMRGKLDILVLTETKLDHTFPEKQFLVPGYKKPFRLDRNTHGGGVMIYVREDIPCDALSKYSTPSKLEAIFVEINLRKNKLLLVGTYHSKNPKYGLTDEEFFKHIGLALDFYSTRYEKFLLAGDFNTQEDQEILDEFLEDYHAKNLVKDPTCFKNLENPSCIDLFITNSYQSFQKTTTVSTGLSDFHKMAVTVLKTTFPKAKPRIVTYRTPYETKDLVYALKENLGKMKENTYEEFEDAVTLSHDAVSAKKQKFLRANDKDFMTKEMRKAIMKRSYLENRKFQLGTLEATQAFKKQKNYCNRLRKRTKKDHYNNLDLKNITDNTKFWDTVCPLFSDKGGVRDRIVLVENDEIISGSVEVAETFNEYFAGSADSLGIIENKLLLNPVHETDGDVEKFITKFESHPSIVNIKRHVQIDRRFDFSPVSHKEIEAEISALDSKKNGGCISTKLLKEVCFVISKPLAEVWNSQIIRDKTFSRRLKLGDISPVFKALESTLKKNYRPITVLITVSKIFERIMDKQSTSFIENFLSKYLCGYRKEYNCQIAMVSMIERLKKSRDNREYAACVLLDLSKAFDTINHELLIAKMFAYGFSLDALKIVHSYLSDRWHRTKIDGSYSTWRKILQGMPQGSVNGPKWFNIYLNDLFFLFLNTEVCNIADDTTPYACDADLGALLHNLESDVASALIWFDANYMKPNQTKCHLLAPSQSPEMLWIQVGEQIIWESQQERLLGVMVDRDLSFQQHMENLCKKAGAKVTALGRLVTIVSMDKKRTIMSAFVESQFSHCPLVWMFNHSRKLNDRINHIHERGLRMVYGDYASSFEELLRRDGSVTIHHRNIQLVAILMFQVKKGQCPEIMRDLFQLKEGPGGELRFLIPKVNSEYMGKLSLRYFGPVVWETMLPNAYKEIDKLEKFKEDIKKWVPICLCRLCKTYVQGLGFVETTN